MGINGVGSFYGKNYDVQSRGQSARGKQNQAVKNAFLAQNQ